MSDTLATVRRIYFVRHGETNCNVDLLVQGPQEPLNENGLRQAAKIAERARHIAFQKIIASDHPRAQQTAQVIAAVKQMPVESSPLFGECRPPSQFVGMPVSTPEFRDFQKLQFEQRHDPSWHFSDEENVHDILLRVDNAWALLEEEEAETILVVTHGMFLRSLIGKLILRELLDADVWHHMGGVMKTSNTGITVCEHADGRWRLITWNDHAHFAE